MPCSDDIIIYMPIKTIKQSKDYNLPTHTHTHTHTERERNR